MSDTEPPSSKNSRSFSVSSSSRPVWRSGGALHIRLPKVDPKRFSYRRLPPTRLRITAVVALLILSLGCGFLGGWLGHRTGGAGSVFSSTSDSQKVVTSESQLISQIAKTVGPSVVSVDVVSTDTSSSGGLYGLFNTGPSQQEDAGTGIIISSDGLIMTNRHVVPSGATSVSVTLSDGTELDNVQVVGRTNDNDSLDIAFLKITDAKGHKLTPATLGDSSKVAVGDAVVAIGNALGQFQNTVTSGIISGYGRSVQAGDSSGLSSATENLDDLFQTDAAINEGNSGGPLVNMNGQVIGINTAIASNSENIGFAIPINDVAGLIKQVEATGKFQRPYLGVHYLPVTGDVVKQYNLSVTNGAFIAPSGDGGATQPIIPGSPAEKAGLQINDVITAVNGSTVDQSHSLTSLIGQHSVGDTLDLTVVRGGKTMHVSVKLTAVPSS